MTENEFLAAWKLVFGYDVVNEVDAYTFKYGFKNEIPTHQFMGLLTTLKSKRRLIAHGNKWRLAHETSKVVAG